MNLETLVLPLKIEDNIRAGLIGIGAGITAFIGLAAGALAATEKWSSELDSIGDIMGATNKDAAALNFVLRKSGTETGKLTKGMTVLEKGLVKSDGSLDNIGKSLKEFGIDVKGVNGQVKDQTALLAEIGNKYNSFSTQQERVNFLTATFGKSGADLIDFFDTLNNEGGLDGATKKVTAFGLAIDPARYEQFNRKLEEIKLMGLGLAVGFTEKLMPAIEGFVNWVVSLQGLTPPEIFKKILEAAGNLWKDFKTALGNVDTKMGEILDSLATAVDNWVANGGPERLVGKVVAWIEQIGTGETGTGGSKTLAAAGRLVSALANAFMAIDWSAVGNAITSKLQEQFDKLEVQIDATGWLKGLIASLEVLLGLFIASRMIEFFYGLVTAIGAAKFSLGLFSVELAKSGGVLGLFGRMLGWLTVGLGFLRDALGLTSLTITQFAGVFALAIGAAIAWWELGKKASEIGRKAWEDDWLGIRTFITTQLDIVTGRLSEFWGKVKQGFADAWESSRRAVENAVNGIIRLINSIPGVNIPTIPSTKKGRASGGPVIAGQSYNVAEFYRPEVFTPSTNGRIDAMKNQTVVASFSNNDLSLLADYIVHAMARVSG